MTFDATGIVVFLLAIVPGFVAQASRHSIVPRSLRQKSTLEETGDFVLNSLFVHVFFVLAFRVCLTLWSPGTLESIRQALTGKQVLEWSYGHKLLILIYLGSTIVGGFLFGLLRGIVALNQPVRNLFASYRWYQSLLTNLGIPSFVEEGPVWYGALRQRGENELTFVQVRMKAGAGFYTGELHSYGILDDSEKNKDFYLVNCHFKESSQADYSRLDVDGILLNFGDVDSIEVMKRLRS